MSDVCEVIGMESDSDRFCAGGWTCREMLCTENGSEREVSEVVSWMMVFAQGFG